MAEGYLRDAAVDPAGFDQIARNRSSDNIYYQTYPNASLANLPKIYQDNPEILENREEGSVYPSLVEGVYIEVPSSDGVSPATVLE